MQLTDICRICLIKSSKTSDELFFPIDEGFEKKFNEITNLILYKSQNENLNFPKNVCISCVSELESHFNYRCGLIEKQKRLNILLGIRNDFEQNIKDPVIIKPDPKDIDEQTVYIEDQPIEEAEEEEEQIENSEILDDPESVEEILCDEEEAVEEMMTYEQVYKDDDEEYEIEQEYVDEADDKYYFIKGDVEADDSYIVFEDQTEPSTSDVKPKRKYTKQSKDAEKQFKCWMEDCVAVFSFRATMRKHMQSIHGVECDKSTCLICGERFDEYSTFLAHVKIHTRKSECDVCKLRFVNDEKMLAHKARVHANDLEDRCYPCEVRELNFFFIII